MYKDQIEDQKKNQSLPVKIEEEEYKVKKILNKQKFRKKDRYLVWWRKCMTEKDIWEPRENLEDIRELVEKFEKEYSKKLRRVRKENWEEFCKRELLGKYMAKNVV